MTRRLGHESRLYVRSLPSRPRAGMAGFGLALTMGVLAGLGVSVPASAQEDNFTADLLSGLGLLPKPQAEIEYRERAPLVVPPSGDVLPPPRDHTYLSENPAWPKDVDVVERQKAAVEARKPNYILSDRGATRALTPAEVARGTRAGGGQIAAEPTGSVREKEGWIQPKNLGFLGWGNKQEEKAMTFDGEPERQRLVEPPPGYQTPAANAPYGVVAEREEQRRWSMPSWFDRTQRTKTD